MTSTSHNGFFAVGADALLSNNNNYFARSTMVKRSVAALANYLATGATIADSLLRQVLYPTTGDTRDNYEDFRHRITAEFALGDGDLMSIKFEDVSTARAFYDNLQLHCGPHLGAHLTLVLPFNAIANGRNPEEAR